MPGIPIYKSQKFINLHKDKPEIIPTPGPQDIHITYFLYMGPLNLKPLFPDLNMKNYKEKISGFIYKR